MEIYGGQALRNGVMLKGQHFIVKARRQPDGRIEFEEVKLEDSVIQSWRDRMGHIPLLRGILLMLELIFYDKIIAFLNISAVLIYLFAYFVPSSSQSSGSLLGMILYLLATVLSIAVVVILASIMFGPLGKYHAAEHMTINAWEQGMEINLDEVRKQSRVNPNCGTNLTIFIITVYLLLIPVPIGHYLRFAASFAVGYEIFIVSEGILYTLLRPFYWFGSLAQYYLFTSKPAEQHLEVGIACFMKLKELEKKDKVECTAFSNGYGSC